jgi:hypothetical protein
LTDKDEACYYHFCRSRLGKRWVWFCCEACGNGMFIINRPYRE